MKDLLIGIDAGTSVIKSIAFTLDGRQVGMASVRNEYTLIEGGGAEQNAAVTWRKTLSTLKELCETIANLPERVAAIAVTGQGDGTWLIDKKGDPVGEALLWLDARAAQIAATLTRQPADARRFELTGTGLAACQQGPQLLWLLQNRPAWVSHAASAFHCKDWLYFKLTDTIATDPSEGIFSFGDFRNRQYSAEVLGVLGLTTQRSLLPEIVDGTQSAGALSHDAALASGLLQATPVVLGYVDVVCTALGAGMYDTQGSPGVTIVGSTGMHMRLARGAASVSLSEEKTGYLMCFPIDDTYTQIQSNMAATLNIDWLLDMAAGLVSKLGVERSRAQLLGLLDAWVADAPPGSVLYQPYICEAGERGPFTDANARAGFVGLSTQHGFEHLARGVVEGLCFAARDCYTTMGQLPSEIRISGGAARSTQLMKILSATLGANVRTSSREEAGAAGAAMMAAVSIGHYQSMDDCVAEWVTPLLGEMLTADADLSRQYQSLFPVYRQAREALRPVWKGLAEWRSTEGSN